MKKNLFFHKMKIAVTTFSVVEAFVKPISKDDLTRLAKATAGRNVNIELEPTSTLGELIAAVTAAAAIDPPLPITRVDIVKDGALLSGNTLAECGLTDGCQLAFRYIHQTDV